MSASPTAALLATLQSAEAFIAGFEDDSIQEPPVAPLLAQLRAHITALTNPTPTKTFDSLPLATCSPSLEERARWINVLDPLLKYAGSPGDWGRDSKLGLLTMRLMQVRAALADASTLPREGGAA